jgi:hypothetical protein
MNISILQAEFRPSKAAFKVPTLCHCGQLQTHEDEQALALAKMCVM